jgi:hypothetical protein
MNGAGEPRVNEPPLAPSQLSWGVILGAALQFAPRWNSKPYTPNAGRGGCEGGGGREHRGRGADGGGAAWSV